MLMGGFLTCNDSDILRAKTGPYRRVGYQTNILPTAEWRQLEVGGEGEGRLYHDNHLLPLYEVFRSLNV